ncbi:hypothetical protein Asppvi_002721 [Aspergillus pseudoviridinutans]|uniref:Uncharacterized protein n=1 Tax=Aspergillus pseudoviridinutans TaxID=1517512 RepID=A0A9P3ESP3_9EURO|nr:uncharacterized protein Asppvi_002721 [Aspergillus pseudoviridinutans]GIJ83890.1 hypothetical protein Asppvi_002721 [Aspergillus pseudoviridinutans]
MPVYVVDGIRYRVPLTSIFRPRTLCKDLLATDAYRRARAAAKHNTNFLHTETEIEALWTGIMGSRPGNNDASKWNRDDGRVLHQLETRGISRAHFFSALSDCFIEELKDQFNRIRGDRLQTIRKADRRTFWYASNLPHDGGLTSPDHLVTDGKTVLEFEEIDYEGEYDDSRHQDIDQDCTLEDVTLLREIAAQWKRDQWQAISTRFNGVTGRKITPEQAKSVLDNYQG